MEAFAARTRPARAPLGLRSPRLLRVASDERLVALARAGVDPAFEAIYDRHHRQILSFCRHLLGSHEEGEDAVQQTFLSAHAALLGSDRPIQLRAWLFTIARNRCLSMLRARREQPTGETIEVATAGLAEQVQEREDLRDLLVDLARLPEEQRSALVLAELGALGHDEIAEVLEVPRPRVKALVFQARESLIASRVARQTDCREIREQLATLTGGALRRAPLRRHLAVCDGCRAYKAEISLQRRALALILPVVPSAALKHAALPVASAGIATSGAASGGLAGGAATKLAAVVVVAATAAGGTVAAVDHRHPPHPAPAAAAPAPAPAQVRRAAPAAQTRAVPVATQTARPAATPAHHRRQRSHRSHAAALRSTSASTTHPIAPGASANTPSRTGATPSHANPTPGVPRRAHGSPAKAAPARPHPVHPVHPAHPVHPVHPVHPSHPAHPAPPPQAAHGHAGEPHGKP